ncbi:MAG: small GTP-binding protein [Candidatus Nanohaloarchaea archaeon]|jgi:small GTP-binding protein
MSKIELPLDRLNEALDGGVEDGSNVLFLADLAVDKSKFASALVNYRMEQEDNVIYFINNKMPQYVKERVDNPESENFAVIDGFSSTLGKESNERFQIDTNLKADRKDYIEESKDVAIDAMEEMESWGSTFILDSLDAFVGQWDEMQDFAESLRPVAGRTSTVNYFLLPNLGFEDEGDELEELEEIFDYVIHLKGIERSGIILKFIEIRKPDVETRVPFDITPRGLVMYVPKLLVTGPYDAGKSTTVQSMSEESVSVDRLGTTVALDHGQVEKKGLKAELFGTPGQKRFDWALDFLGQSMFGCFIVVDSRDPNYDRVEELKQDLTAEELPFIILANFQNKDDALSPEEIEEETGIETLGVDAKNGENLDQSLERLMDKIMDQHSWYYA